MFSKTIVMYVIAISLKCIIIGFSFAQRRRRKYLFVAKDKPRSSVLFYLRYVVYHCWFRVIMIYEPRWLMRTLNRELDIILFTNIVDKTVHQECRVLHLRLQILNVD